MDSILSQLILDVFDISRSLTFYHEVLGLPVVDRQSLDGHELATLAAGPVEVLLVQQPEAEARTDYDRSGGLVMSLRVPNLAQLCDAVDRAQIPVICPAEDAPIGNRSVLINDPDGYALLVFEKTETVH